VRKIKILGWILLPFNIVGLWFCIYTMQAEANIVYLFGTGLLIGQFIYIVKTLEVLKQFEIGRGKLESAVKKVSLNMAKIIKGKKGEEQAAGADLNNQHKDAS
jgi:hypothetical protein